MTNNKPDNTHSVLADILGSLQLSGDAIDYYISQNKKGEILNPIRAQGKISPIEQKEALPNEFFAGFGIRTLVLDALHGKLSLSGNNFIDAIANDTLINKWNDWKDDVIMEDLKMLFEYAEIIEFEKWSDIKHASILWDNLRRDVIRPLKRNDFDFVFYLGDTSKHFAFEVDEFLDIVCDYSMHGRVTLVLDEQNMDSLWAMFFGSHADSDISILPGLREKCRTVYDLINIEHLIIESFPSTIMFSKKQQFEIQARNRMGFPNIDSKHFDAGYILGLLLNMTISHSMVLGLAVSGLYAENGFKPDRKNLLNYIENWMREKESLKKKDDLQLTLA